MMFLGTPHHGSKIASLGNIAFDLSHAFMQNHNLKVLRWLEAHSEILERITEALNKVLQLAKSKGTDSEKSLIQRVS
jgi:hypothetical protein